MKRGEAQQLLTATNRWWRDPVGWTKADPDLREAGDAPYDYRATVLDGLTPGGLYLLRGPRRVGKTVAVKQAIRDLVISGVPPRRIVHMAVDGLRSRDLPLLVDAAEALTLEDGGRFWFFDEITGITDGWPERVKWLRDNDARFRADTVVLTGSSSADLTGATKALAGRRGPVPKPDRVLMPIGFRSFVTLASPDAPVWGSGPLAVADLTVERLREAARDLAPWLDTLVRSWDTYLRVGGFPAAVASYVSAREEPWALQASLLDVVHGDAFRRADWSRAQSGDLLRRIAMSLCSPLNVASLANDVGVSWTAAASRLDDLREAFVVWPCYREKSLRPRLGAQYKLYFTDPVYARLGDSSAAMATADGPPETDFSRLSQQQLGMALLRAGERAAPGSLPAFDRVLHHRTATRREIDFVGPTLGGLAFESKYVDGKWRRDAQTLDASPWRGVVATRSELAIDEPKVLAIPAGLLAWLVDS